MPKSILSTSRLSSIALVALASFLPMATGCTQQATWAPPATERDVSSTTAQVPTAMPDPTPTPLPGIATSQNTFEATGQAYYTIQDDGVTTTVQGFYVDGTAASTVTLGGDGSTLTADFQDPGQAADHLSLSVDPGASSSSMRGTFAGAAFTLQVDASGNVVFDPTQFTSTHNVGAALIAFDMFNSSSVQRRAWACAVCVGAAIAIVGAIVLLVQSGLGAALITNLINSYRIFGSAGVLAILKNQAANLSPAARAAILAALGALATAGTYVINKCIECYTGEAGGVAQAPTLTPSTAMTSKAAVAL